MTRTRNISEAAAAMGRKGGRANTEAQHAARRENGTRGGRPRVRWSVGDKVEGGHTVEDYDHGEVIRILDAQTVEVAWAQSLTRTPADVTTLRPYGRRILR